MATTDLKKSGCVSIGRVIRSRGFTLIELMIVVVIVAILASIAYPSYIRYVTKTKRSAAEACLSEYANYMERYYTTNLRYDQDSAGTANALPVLDCASNTQTGENYAYALPAAALSAASYEVTATPINSQLARDGQCGVLALKQNGQRYYNSTLFDTAGLETCWK